MTTKTLTLLAGIVWLIAGINVCKIGIETWATLPSTTVLMVVGCVLTLAAFSAMFVRMVFKNIRRIEQIPVGQRRAWHMMSLKSYAIMAFMITLGLLLRRSPAVPATFIAWFYVGLGTALATAGIVYTYMALFSARCRQ